MAAAMPWPTRATTHGRYRPGSGTKTSSTRCVTPNLRRIDLRTSGDNRRSLRHVEGAPDGSQAGSLRQHRRRFLKVQRYSPHCSTRCLLAICIIPPHGGAYLMPANYRDGVEPEATRRSKFSGWCSPVTGSRTNGKAAHALADDEPHLRSLDSALNPKDLRKKRSRTFKRRRVCSRKHWVAPTIRCLGNAGF